MTPLAHALTVTALCLWMLPPVAVLALAPQRFRFAWLAWPPVVAAVAVYLAAALAVGLIALALQSGDDVT